MSGLFRDEAVQAQRTQALGTVRLATPVAHQVWGIAAVVTTAAIALWLCFGHYTRREHVTGSLVPQAGLLTLSARSAGVISQLRVKPGTPVTAGEALLVISGDQSSVALGDTDAAVAEALLRQQEQIRATLAALPEQVSAQSRDFHTRISMLDTQVGQISQQLALQRTEAATADSLAHKVKPLLKEGYISAVQWSQFQASALNAQAQIEQLQRERLDTEQQRSQLAAELQQLPLTTAATAHQLRGQLEQLAATAAQNDVACETVLRATRAGTVTSVLVEPGQAITADQPLLSILPKGSPLEAQLLVPSSAIGFVHDGTPVALHYQAFPYQKFGVQHGTVSDVSRNALTPTQITSLLGQQPPPEPLYRVEVTLANQSIDAYGKRQVLLPGMVLDADLLLDSRRMIQWIFEPVYGMAKRDGGRS